MNSAGRSIHWTTLGELKVQLARLWERGVFLRPLLTGESMFPYRLKFKGPTSADLTGRFEEVRDWLSALDGIRHIRVERRAVMHRVQGLQQVPQAVWIDSLDDVVAMIGKRSDVASYEAVVAMTRVRLPVLLPWLEKRPLQAIGLVEEWPLLLDIIEWLVAHPRPGIYLRQVDIPGIHTKFIEAQCDVLTELLDLVLPPEAIDARQTGVRRFASRYGFLDKPALIRLRVLDSRIQLLPGPRRPDISLDAASFAELAAPVRRVFITENETNFLAFPKVRGAIVIFGAGYGWDALAKATWLAQCSLHYWGDIDTHGFSILDSLRSRFPQTESFLMDQTTFMAHRHLWGQEAKQVVHPLTRLTKNEEIVYNLLRDNRIGSHLRLEQEVIGYGFLQAALRAIVGEQDARQGAGSD